MNGFLLASITASIVASGVTADAGSTQLVSHKFAGGSGITGDGASFRPSISGNGRWVVFSSSANNLVPGDNAFTDIFLRDTQTNQTERVSVDKHGIGANDSSDAPAISRNGKFVAFVSFATNLIPGGTNDKGNVFVRNLTTGNVERVTLGVAGAEPNGVSSGPFLSSNGRFVVFTSSATNLVSGDTKGKDDVFIHDRKLGSTKRVSINSNDAEANGDSFVNGISGNARYIVFTSEATNFVPFDLNVNRDVFVRDTKLGTTERVNVDSQGNEAMGTSGEGVISDNGRFVAFDSNATNLVVPDANGAAQDMYVHDRKTGATTRVSLSTSGIQGDSNSIFSTISSTGRYVTFESEATNLVANDGNGLRDLFVRDRKNANTKRISLGKNGQESHLGGSFAPKITANGKFIAFESVAPDFGFADSNGSIDVYIRDWK